MKKLYLGLAVALPALIAANAAFAQETSPAQSAAAKSEPSETGDIVVTGTKSLRGTSVHNAALAVTALGPEQIEQAHVLSIKDIQNLAPNVRLADGAFGGSNNFAIRGMGIYSSVPTSTPTVGIFVDGVYIGVNAGTALKSMFDVEGVEVLRGPQGLLFGRNVTAGAILLRTTEPSDTLVAKAEVGIESGPLYRGSALVSGPLDSNGVWSAKVALTGLHDDGWFHNDYNKRKFGKNNTGVVRAALKFAPSGDVVNVLRLEAGKQDADGAVSHNSALYGRNSFKVNQDVVGYSNFDWAAATLETRINVGFGNGQIVNIAAFRKLASEQLFDDDASPNNLFNFSSEDHHRQWSDELRYAGEFGPVSATVGLYYYTDRLVHVEMRQLFGGAAVRIGGGRQNSKTLAAFSNFDIALSPQFTLNLGARYSYEEKTAKSAVAVSPGATNPCVVATFSCASYPFTGHDDWSAFTPKVGFQWRPSSSTNIYGYWTKGNRSGGFNIRNYNPAVNPVAYDQETVSTFEAGIKQRTPDGKGRISIAAFHNKFKKLQRDISFPDPALGIVQITANTADATIYGFELDASYQILPGLRLGGNVGYLHGEYDRLLRALASSGVITPAQLKLKLPYLAPWSYGASFEYTVPVGDDEVTLSSSFSHQDWSFSQDLNLGRNNAINNLDADLSWTTAGDRLKFSIYGRNLLNNVVNGLEVPLGATFNNAFMSPLNERGRVYGAKVRINF